MESDLSGAKQTADEKEAVDEANEDAEKGSETSDAISGHAGSADATAARVSPAASGS